MKWFISLLLSVISAIGAPLCLHYGWIDAVNSFIIVGALSYSFLAYSIAKELYNLCDKDKSNGRYPSPLDDYL